MYDLDKVDIKTLIQKFREGVPLTLVCKTTHEGFSQSSFYPISKISMGNALEVMNDQGERILLDDEYDYVECFTVVENTEDLAEISRTMKEQQLNPLLELADRFMQKHEYREGDVVKWKPGLQMMSLPAVNQPAVVLELLDEPVIDHEAELGDPARSIRCDMMIGFMVDDQRMVTTLADSRRFDPFDMGEG